MNNLRKILALLSTMLLTVACGKQSAPGISTIYFKGVEGNIVSDVVAVEIKGEKEKPILSFYFEVNSTSAIQTYHKIKDTLILLTKNEDIELRLNSLVFLNNKNDRGNSLLFTKVMGVIAKDYPDKLSTYLDYYMVEEINEVTEETLKILFESWGLKKEKIEKIMLDQELNHNEVVKNTETFIALESPSMPYITVTYGDENIIIDTSDLNKIEGLINEALLNIRNEVTD